MTETIKCTCSNCGAKYRLPVEAQGRTARCKRCGKGFQIPRQDNLEDTVLSWLEGPADEDEEVIAQPRVISMPDTPGEDEASDASKRARGPIRMKSSAVKEGEK